MSETREERIERLRRLVIEHDSYAEVARRENMSRERIRKLVGNGLTSLAKGAKSGKCINCKRKYKAVIRPAHDGRCERCREFLSKYGQTWSPKTAENVRRSTHCHRGHELTPENLYLSRNRTTGVITRSCRICKRRAVNEWAHSPEGKAAIKEWNRRAYERMKSDPELWEKQKERVRKWQRRKRAQEVLLRKDK